MLKSVAMDKEFLYKLFFYSKKLLNGALFYAGWFYCVMSAAKGYPQEALFVTAAILIIHFLVFEQRRKDVILLITMVPIGFLLDSSYAYFGWVRFHSPNPLYPWMAPLWVLSLYAIFAITLNHSLSWLKAKPLYSAVLGTGGIASTYLAGLRLGAIDFIEPWYIVLGGIGAIWFFYTPALFAFCRYLDKRLGD